MRALPTPISHRSGAKVAWDTYATRKDALEASRRAKADAKRLEAYGYDFGFCVPGEITQVEDGWEVCIP